MFINKTIKMCGGSLFFFYLNTYLSYIYHLFQNYSINQKEFRFELNSFFFSNKNKDYRNPIQKRYEEDD